MLALTPTAVEAIREILVTSDLPPEAGLRVALEKPGNGTEPEFGLSVVPGPEDEDAVVESEGARVFIEPAASGYFEDKVLDAELIPEGATFTFAPAEN